MKATAAVFMGPNVPFAIREFDVLPAPKGYGRSDLIACGVCGTDIHIHRGKLGTGYPSIIGHEFIGRLTDLDEEDGKKFGLKKGDCVIADIAVPCGECLLCRTGDDANCVNMKVTNGGSVDTPPYLYGGYAEVNFTPLTNLIRVPDELDPTMTAVFACPGPTILHAVRLAEQAGVDLKQVHTAVVQGFGPVGCFAVACLKAMGVEKVSLITATMTEEKKALAKKLGADAVYDLASQGKDAVTSALQQENGGLGVDLCIEASGAPTAFPQGMNILRNRGVYLVPGQYSNSGGIEIQPQLITFKAIHLIGSSQYSVCDVKAYLDFLAAHPELHAAIRSLATCYKVADVNAAFDDAKARRNVKTLLVR